MSRPTAKRPYGSGSLLQLRGSWFGQWRIDGRLVKRKLGPVRTAGAADGLTRRQAEDRLRKLMLEIKAPPAVGRLSVGELGALYVEHARVVRNRKATTVQDYEGILRRHLDPYFGRRAADAVTGEEVARYVAVKRGAGLAPKTVSNHLVLLHGIFAFAVRRGYLERNPVHAAERPALDRASRAIRFLTIEELRRLLAVFPATDIGRLDRTLVLVAATTGLRQGELLALRWADVEFDAALVRVARSYTRGRFTTPKSGRSTRTVPLAGWPVAALTEHRERSAYVAHDDMVFAHPESGHVLDASRLRRRFRSALQAAGVRTVRFHDLRHTYGTQMAAAGAPLRALQEWMGHRDYKTTELYADYLPGHSRAAEFGDRAFGTGPQNL